jgi:hypothetical protein
MKLPKLPGLCRNNQNRLPIESHPGGESELDSRKRSPKRQIPNAAEVKLERDCRSCRRNRRGAAVVEFAVVAPVFFLLIFGMIEFGQAIMIQQMMTNAAREGARYAVLDGSTSSDAKTKVRDYLTPAIGATQAQAATVKVYNSAGAEAEPSTITYGQSVWVSVQIPFKDISWLPSPWFLKTKTLTARAVMRRETVQ